MPDKEIVVVFPTTHLTLKAESILEREGVEYRTVMKPRKISSDCGLAIRIHKVDLDRIRELLTQAPVETTGFFVESGNGWEPVVMAEGQ